MATPVAKIRERRIVFFAERSTDGRVTLFVRASAASS